MRYYISVSVCFIFYLTGNYASFFSVLKQIYLAGFKPCRRRTYFYRIPPGPVRGLPPLWTDVQQPVVAEVSRAFNAFGLDAPAVLLPLP